MYGNIFTQKKMPTVKLKPTPGQRPKRPYIKKDDDEARAIRNRFYNSARYKKVKALKIRQNPICEICDLQGITQFGQQVHHWYSPFQVTNETDKWELGLSMDNLVTLCSKCHSRLHNSDLKGCHSMYDVALKLKINKNTNNTDEI